MARKTENKWDRLYRQMAVRDRQYIRGVIDALKPLWDDGRGDAVALILRSQALDCLIAVARADGDVDRCGLREYAHLNGLEDL